MDASLRTPRLLLLVVVITGCGHVSLEPAEPPRAPASPLDDASLLLDDSVLETAVLYDLEPKVAKLEAALVTEIDRTAGRDAEPEPGEGEGDAVGADGAADPKGADDEGGEDGDAEEVDSTDAPDGDAPDGPDAPEDAWRELREGVQVRSLIRRDEVTTELDGGTLTTEAEFMVGVLARVERPQRRRRGRGRTQEDRWELRSCGCDGEAWCEGEPDPPRRARVRWTTHLRIGPDWRLVPDTHMEMVIADDCRLGEGPDGHSIEPMEVVVEALEDRILEAGRVLDEAISSSEAVGQAVARIWKPLAEPALLERVRGRLWLRPHAIGVGELESREGKLLVRLHYAMRPTVLALDTELEAPPVPEPVRTELPERGLRVGMSLDLPLDDLSAQIASPLVGRRFSRKHDRHLRIKAVKVYGSPEGPVVRLDVAGSAEGPLFLRGRLVLDQDDKVIALEDLAFDRDSKVALNAMYDVQELPDLKLIRVPWVEPDDIRDAVQDLARWSFRDAANELREDVAQALRRRLTANTKMSVALDDAVFSNLVMDGEAVRLLMVFVGRAEVRFRTDPEPVPGNGSRARIHPRLED
jgi:hypothetical protein